MAAKTALPFAIGALCGLVYGATNLKAAERGWTTTWSSQRQKAAPAAPAWSSVEVTAVTQRPAKAISGKPAAGGEAAYARAAAEAAKPLLSWSPIETGTVPSPATSSEGTLAPATKIEAIDLGGSGRRGERPTASEPARPAEERAATGADAASQKPVQSYCVNITNPALDARYMRQKSQLEGLREELKQRTAALDGKIAEYKDWLGRRDEFANKAHDSLVSIYAAMKAEAAAKQLTELDEETASSLLSKLDARQSSAILSEMEPKKAARLMEIVSGASRLSDATEAIDAANQDDDSAEPVDEPVSAGKDATAP